MLIYFGIISFLGLGVIIEKISDRKRIRESFFLFSLLLLILFFGLRGYIGYDWYSYKPNFDKMVTIGELLKGNTQVLYSGYELGFQIYTSFIKTLTKLSGFSIISLSSKENFSFLRHFPPFLREAQTIVK